MRVIFFGPMGNQIFDTFLDFLIEREIQCMPVKVGDMVSFAGSGREIKPFEFVVTKIVWLVCESCVQVFCGHLAEHHE